MGRYYFDVEKNSELAVDLEGDEIADIHAAESEAANAAMEIGREMFGTGQPGTVAVKIYDEARSQVSEVRVTLNVSRA